ncbi:hypothetical protein [Anaerobaca lacustris]|uniref:Uncharacterized protein n=1 Tax=Anaerobaca lacustris TaxID=3044600 RepID=A0AAW6TTF9_9BACT|nr:hypothetical protein [Sedimentisphaerales bacterium M17dextr]
MGKKQEEAVKTPIKATSPRGRSFRVNAHDLEGRIAELEAGLAEARANLDAISTLLDKMSRG